MAAADNSNKLDRVLANMEILLKANDQTELQLKNILVKLEALESSQKKTAEEINDLKESYNHLEGKINEVESKVDEKVSRTDVAALERNIEDLENRSKRNNIVI